MPIQTFESTLHTGPRRTGDRNWLTGITFSHHRLASREDSVNDVYRTNYRFNEDDGQAAQQGMLHKPCACGYRGGGVEHSSGL